MFPIVNNESMRLSDKLTIENGTSSLELMKRAAKGIYDALKWEDDILIVVGKGNNGGDGFALAHILHKKGYHPLVMKLFSCASKDAMHYEQLCVEDNISIIPYTKEEIQKHKMIVDCILGTGFKGKVDSYLKDVFQMINQQKGKSKIISADIPSGVNGDDGPSDEYIESDINVSVQALKLGDLLDANTKEYVIVDIGIHLINPKLLTCRY